MLGIGQFIVRGIGRLTRDVLYRPVIPTGLTHISYDGIGKETINEKIEDHNNNENPGGKDRLLR
jgi:hypothetical protein